MYLESIFSAPDIQRQLPNEAKMFIQVDKSWKEIMRHVHKLPNALRAATRPGACACVRACVRVCMRACLCAHTVCVCVHWWGWLAWSGVL